jgi:pimeloyl-ACP methyl ester carboxylesterase
LAVKTFAGGQLFGERYGAQSPRVVALHGWGRTRADFDAVLRSRDAVALDLPGFGVSPPPPSAVGTEWYRDAVIPVLEELDAPPVLLGHSFGGRIAVQVAAARPDLVEGLVLVGVPLLHRADRTIRKPPIGYRMIRLASRLGLVGEARLEAARQKYGSADYAAAEGVMREILVRVVNESYEAQLPQVAASALLVWGSEDRDVPVEVARRAAAMMPEASLEVLDGVGHHVPLERPDAVEAALERFGV